MENNADLIDGYPLGERIRFFRKKRKLTQLQLAKKCGLSQSAIAHIEKSFVLPSLDTLKSIAKHLDSHPSILMSSDDVAVFDIKKLNVKYMKWSDLTPSMRRALVRIEKYLKEVRR